MGSLHCNFVFESGNAMLRVPAMQRGMIDALQTIPGVKRVGSANAVSFSGVRWTGVVFTDRKADPPLEILQPRVENLVLPQVEDVAESLQ